MKAFNTHGYENIENNVYPDYNFKPAMMFCGQDASAKATVGALIEQLAGSRWMLVESSRRFTWST